MKLDRIKAVVREAERFIGKAREAEATIKAEGSCTYTKQNAAMKRASLDLTRALADLRRG